MYYTSSVFLWLCILMLRSKIIPASTHKVCGVGWFGPQCQYRCRCLHNTCDTDGACLQSSTCSAGWFGYKCQYNDVKIKAANLKTLPAWLTDDEQDTCNNSTYLDMPSVTLQWNVSFPFRSLRMVFKYNVPMTNFKLQLYSRAKDDWKEVQCLQHRYIVIDNRTLDYRCRFMNETIGKIDILGDAVQDLCSVYINGGRNVALRQPTYQSSDFSETSTSDKAVDGNDNQTFASQTCTHTAQSTTPPYWVMTLNHSHCIDQIVLYNRVDCCSERLSNFKLQTYDNENNLILTYTDTKDSSVYQVVYRSIDAVKTIKISATKIENIGVYLWPSYVMFLTLCEVEVYGNCPPGIWGLDCSHSCESGCPGTCNVDDGSCDKTCVGATNPPQCNEVCKKRLWGLNCSKECPSKCFNKTCNIENGLCDQGCQGFTDPPLCSTECPATTYGKNCTLQCSDHCLNGSCDSFTGSCWSCVSGYKGQYCDEACDSEFWGNNCKNNCSKRCFNSSCIGTNGLCDQGCLGFDNPPVCDISCQLFWFGHNCTQRCSSNCINSTCDAVTGACSCKPGYTGEYCSTVYSSEAKTANDENVGAIVGPVTIGSTAIVAIVIVILIMRHRRKQHLVQSLNQTIVNTLESYDNNAYQGNPDELEDTFTKQDVLYLNSALQLDEDTTYDAKQLYTLLKYSNSKIFEEQFKRIPVAKNTSTEVALSSENKNKNRYKNICAYDHSRVHLDNNESDYINASYIQGYNKEEIFIASQAPTKVIISDFMCMLWEQKVDKVVMLTNLVEDNKTKCEKYWCDDGRAHFGAITVVLKASQVFTDYTIRSFELIKNGESHAITHFHFTSWPDKDVPPTPWSLVEFKYRESLTKTTRPVVVHCSAGVGRTGTYIALCNVVRQFEKTGQMDFFKTVTLLRADRIFMVQIASQYEFLHKTASVAIMCLRATMTVDVFSEKYNNMRSATSLSVQNLESEFQDLCAACQNFQEVGIETNENDVYQNTENRNVRKRISYFASSSLSEPAKPDLKDFYDYSHSFLLPGFKKKDHYLITPLPIPASVVDFWGMIAEHKMNLIIAIAMDRIYEDKSTDSYLPSAGKNHLHCGPFEIQTTLAKVFLLCEENELVINKKLFMKTETYNVVHLNFKLIDLDVDKILALMKKVRSYNFGNDRICFMCKDGATYSGLPYVLTHLMARVDSDFCISVPLVVGAIKSYMPEIIPDLNQYIFLHTVLQRYINVSCNYLNVGQDFLQEGSSKRKLGSDNLNEDKEFNVYSNSNF